MSNAGTGLLVRLLPARDASWRARVPPYVAPGLSFTLQSKA